MTLETIEYPIYATGGSLAIHVKETLVRTRSPLQEILIVDSEEFGKCLLLDGCIQCAESDHDLYDEALLAKLGPKDQRILVLGGGDGWVAEHAVKRWPNVQVDVVEIDGEVVRWSEKHLSNGIFSHERVHLTVGDAFEFLANAARNGRGLYSGVVADLTDVPLTGPRADDFAAFFAGILECCRVVLAEDGWFSAQAGVPAVTEDYLDLPPLLTKLLARGFRSVERKDVMVPSYGEPNVFLYARPA